MNLQVQITSAILLTDLAVVEQEIKDLHPQIILEKQKLMSKTNNSIIDENYMAYLTGLLDWNKQKRLELKEKLRFVNDSFAV